MATVIDSLLIELGLDASQFNASQKKAVDELQKFDEQSSKTFKNSQKNVNDFGLSMGKTKDALISLGVSLLSIKGFVGLANDITKTNADIGRTSELFGMSARELSAWQNVMKSVGGSSEDFNVSLQNIQGSLAAIQTGGGGEIFKPLGLLGVPFEAVDVENAKVDMLALADAIKKTYDAPSGGRQRAYNLAKDLGISDSLFMVLKQGSSAVKALYEEAYKHTGVTDENTKQAIKNQEAWAKVSTELQAVQNQIANQLLPVMEKLAKSLTEIMTLVVEWDKKMNGGVATSALLASGLLALIAVMRTLGALFGVQVASAAAWSAAIAAAATPLEKLVTLLDKAKYGLLAVKGLLGLQLALYSPALNEGEDEIIKKLKEEANDRKEEMEREEKGATAPAGSNEAKLAALDAKYGFPAGTMEKMWETESGKGSNMGPGSKGDTGHFQFLSGTAAQYGLSVQDTYNFDKSSEAAARYLADLRKQFSNDMASGLAAYNWGPGNLKQYGLNQAPLATQNYLNKFGYNTGITPGAAGNVPIGAGTNLPAGSRGNTTTVDTNIQNVNVYTQATDGNKAAQDFAASLKNIQLTNYGLTGTQ